jgi:hypothetical protein
LLIALTGGPLGTSPVLTLPPVTRYP